MPKNGGAVNGKGELTFYRCKPPRVLQNEPLTCSKTGKTRRSATAHLVHGNKFAIDVLTIIRLVTNLDKACAAEDA
jgi:hypothetical protein